MSSLSVEDVRAIRKEYKVKKGNAINIIELSQRFNVSQNTIRRVAKGHMYSWVEDEQ